jgi:hypothetical protein
MAVRRRERRVFHFMWGAVMRHVLGDASEMTRDDVLLDHVRFLFQVLRLVTCDATFMVYDLSQ